MLTGWRKARARKAAARARTAAHRADPDAGARLVDQFPDEIWPALHSVVAGHSAIRDEIDPRALLETFHCEQVRLALPCVTGADAPLVFRGFTPGDDLLRGAFGVSEPAATSPQLAPGLVLIPLLAFDESGRRLGYGAGYYDRTLAKLRGEGPVLAVGLAYEAQRLRRVPTDAHDAALDWIVTEARARKFSS
jgi:5-formyltetrahydrofolate cyclo-ligase